MEKTKENQSPENKFLIYHHLGLGDHIICNGLVREICKDKTKKFLLPAKKQNFESVKFMFKDIVNLTVVSVYGDECIKSECIQNKCKAIIIGHQFLNQNKSFDVSFYEQINLDFSKRWSSFYIERDYQREINLFNNLNIDKEYCFFHEDTERGMAISEKFFQNKSIIKANKKYTDNIFDYLSILENAKEIHCIESSFLFLIDSFNFKAKLYNHRYARSYPENNKPTLKNKWSIIENQ